MVNALQKVKDKAAANPKVQQLIQNEKFKLAVKHAPLGCKVFVVLLFVMPLIAIMLDSDCYADERPDYFWPVKPGTKDTDDFSVINVSSKFWWIMFLGLLTHLSSLGIQKLEEKQKAKAQTQKEYTSSH